MSRRETLRVSSVRYALATGCHSAPRLSSSARRGAIDDKRLCKLCNVVIVKTIRMCRCVRSYSHGWQSRWRCRSPDTPYSAPSLVGQAEIQVAGIPYASRPSAVDLAVGFAGGQGHQFIRRNIRFSSLVMPWWISVLAGLKAEDFAECGSSGSSTPLPSDITCRTPRIRSVSGLPGLCPPAPAACNRA